MSLPSLEALASLEPSQGGSKLVLCHFLLVEYPDFWRQINRDSILGDYVITACIGRFDMIGVIGLYKIWS